MTINTELQQVPQMSTATRGHADEFNTRFKILEENDFINETNLKEYTDNQIQLITASGIPKLQTYRYSMFATGGQVEFNIPLTTFSTELDTLLVYKNTILLNPDEHYFYDDETVTLVETCNENDNIILLVFKHVPVGDSGSVHGKVIADGTIEEKKLTPTTVDKLNGLNETSQKLVNDLNELEMEFKTFKSLLTDGFTSNQFSDGLTTLDGFNVKSGYYNQAQSRLEI